MKNNKKIRERTTGSYICDGFSLIVPAIILLIIPVGLSISCSSENGEISASGTIEATEIIVSAQTSGKILSVEVTEGSLLKEGDIIARIDSSVMELRREQAKAGVALAEAHFALLMKGARSEDIKQAEDQLIQVSESQKQAKADYQRMKELYSTGSVTQKQYDDAKTRYTVVQAQFRAAEQALSKLKNLARPEDIEMARAQINQATIEVKLIEKQIEDCTITAPCKGTVINKLCEAGEFTVIGSPLAVISDLENMSVTIYVNETELGKIGIGQEAFISIDTFPEKRFNGTVAFISPKAEFTPKNIQTKKERIKQVFGVKIELTNPDGLLKAGIPADAVIPMNSGKERIN